MANELSGLAGTNGRDELRPMSGDTSLDSSDSFDFLKASGTMSVKFAESCQMAAAVGSKMR